MTGADLAWLAGLLEGEGSFRGVGENRAIVRVAMCDRDVVVRAGLLMGSAVHAYPPRDPRHREVFISSLGGSRAATLMRDLHPLLGTRRRSQVEAVLAAYRPRRTDARIGACRATGCERPDQSRGLCRPHYLRAWRSGDWPERTEPAMPPLGATAADRSIDWLAGLLEGEGSFRSTGKGKLMYPVISVQMTDRDVIADAARLLGAASIHEDRRDVDRGWKIMYGARLGGRRAAELMLVLRPLMGQRRKAQIDHALAAYRGPQRLVPAPTGCAVAACERSHRCRGLCHKHYMMWLRDRAAGRPLRIAALR